LAAGKTWREIDPARTVWDGNTSLMPCAPVGAKGRRRRWWWWWWSWPNRDTNPSLACTDKPSVWILSISAGIRTAHLPNKNPERYHYTSVHGVFFFIMSPSSSTLPSSPLNFSSYHLLLYKLHCHGFGAVAC
jgi:hypothetical protein